MRNASGHQCKEKMGGSEKKVNENTYDIFSIKSFWKFHVVVVKNNGKEMYKKSVLHVQSYFFLLIGPIVVSVWLWFAAFDETHCSVYSW